jgi:polyphosphate kinase 2
VLMAKDKKKQAVAAGSDEPLDDVHYRRALYSLQIELVKLQREIIHGGDKILVIFEGRDAAGKDGTIKHIVEHLSPRETRVVALGKPSDRESTAWYFQRYVRHLPAAEEMVLFNRSWYNRAGVERVMQFCSDAQYEEFMETVPAFEEMLERSGIRLFKYYLDISRREQKRRLKARRKDPLKQWKLSPIDEAAIKHWDDYSLARDAMFARTHTPFSPWRIVRADDKHLARLSVIKDLLTHLPYAGKDERIVLPNPEIVFVYDDVYRKKGWIAR